LQSHERKNLVYKEKERDQYRSTRKKG